MSPPELVHALPYPDLQLQNIFAMAISMILRAGRIFFSLSIIYFDLRRRVLRFQLCWDECLQLWVTSLLWLRKWVKCRSGLLLQSAVLLPLCRPYTCQQMT